MSKTFPKLNISLRELSRPRIVREEIVETKPVSNNKVMKYAIVILSICVIFIVINYNVHKPLVMKPKLRKIIRMSCSSTMGVQFCTTQYPEGEYVIHPGDCEMFEFNNMPFTDIRKYNGNYRIPASPDLTLRIRDPCDGIIATMDTNQMAHPPEHHAKKGGMYTKRLVWITSVCYKDFTVFIGTEKIFDATPIQMIERSKLKNKSAYIYESPGVTGIPMISGNGCNEPIHIYSI
tara:strand:- start:563 stop:1264 length:702 start_codon:yes stop_codon:yes gene_type:complete